MLVDNEHQCQLFYRSFPPPRLLSFTVPLFWNQALTARKATGRSTRGLWDFIRHGPVPARGIRLSVYVADAPGRAGSASRIRPRSSIRHVTRTTRRSIRIRADMVKRLRNRCWCYVKMSWGNCYVKVSCPHGDLRVEPKGIASY